MTEYKKIMEKIPLLMIGMPLTVLGMFFLVLISDALLMIPCQLAIDTSESFMTVAVLTANALPYIAIIPAMMYLGYRFLLIICFFGRYMLEINDLVKQNRLKRKTKMNLKLILPIIITLSILTPTAYAFDSFYNIMPGKGTYTQEILVSVRADPRIDTEKMYMRIFWDNLPITDRLPSPKYGTSKTLLEHRWDKIITPPAKL